MLIEIPDYESQLRVLKETILDLKRFTLEQSGLIDEQNKQMAEQNKVFVKLLMEMPAEVRKAVQTQDLEEFYGWLDGI